MKSAAVAGILTLAIAAAGGCRRSPAASGPVTFNRDVAPIVFAKCASCHRPDGVAPFSLLTYDDAVQHADEIAAETKARHMPPWLPEAGEFPIQGDRRLRDDQIDVIQRWATGGLAEGDARDRPAPPAFTDGWELGRPDRVVTTDRPFTVKPGTEDVYRNLVLRTSLDAGVFVRAVEFKTGGAPIHHAVIRVDRTAVSRRRDGEDGQPGFDGMAWDSVQDPGGHFIGWAPGRGPIVAPDGMPWPLDRGADLVVEIHVMPSDRPIPIQPTIGLHLTPTPPAQIPITVKMGSKTIDIPPGQDDYAVTDTFVMPVAGELLSVYPHAHFLGKEMVVTATLPGGATKSLIHIKAWSFHWQQDYRYVTPIRLPRGTTLTMRYTFDNSERNPDNPRRPPVRVQSGPRSIDEMADLGLQFVPESTADRVRLVETFAEHETRANMAMAELRVRTAPDVAMHQVTLGGIYVEVGRFADAMPHLERALRLDGRSAAAHNYLGVALMALGRLPEAVRHFEAAVRIAPREEVMYFNLGNAYGAASRHAEAGRAYERALALNPEFLDAHVNLGALWLQTGRAQDALAHFERALELQPDSAVIHTNVSSALAASGRFAEAMQHVRRALALDPAYGPARDNLRRLQQMGIR